VAQEAAIIVATKNKEQSEAQTIAETARALAIAAEEKVTTARATEIAERDKDHQRDRGAQVAETNAMPITVMAEAEKAGRCQQGRSDQRPRPGRRPPPDHARDRRQGAR